MFDDQDFVYNARCHGKTSGGGRSGDGWAPRHVVSFLGALVLVTYSLWAAVTFQRALAMHNEDYARHAFVLKEVCGNSRLYGGARGALPCKEAHLIVNTSPALKAAYDTLDTISFLGDLRSLLGNGFLSYFINRGALVLAALSLLGFPLLGSCVVPSLVARIVRAPFQEAKLPFTVPGEGPKPVHKTE